MEVRYVKRFRMRRALGADESFDPFLPNGYLWLPWHHRLTEPHGRVIYQSFSGDLDSVVFPTFREQEACLRLMHSLASAGGFLPKGTWLIVRPNERSCEKVDYCATIQGIRSGAATAAIQNVAVRPEFRRIGLGRAIVLKGLEGFRDSGCKVVTLEATAENRPALELYEGLGFEIFQTVYKESYIP